MALLMSQPGNFMCSFDLKSGYHHIDIHKEHWQYLCFYGHLIPGLNSAMYTMSSVFYLLVWPWHILSLLKL